MLAALFKMLALLVITFGVLLPLVVVFERRHQPVLRGRIGFSREGIDPDVSVFEFLRPLGNALRLLTVEGWPRGATHPALAAFAPGLAFAAALSALAVIPFGAGAYAFGKSSVSLVVADLDWGILAVFVALGLVQFADVLSSWAGGAPDGRRQALRASVWLLASSAAVALSGLGLFMWAGDLGLAKWVGFQDGTVAALAWLGSGEPGTLRGWLEWLRLPAWGIVFQPLGFGLFVACAWLAIARPLPALERGAGVSDGLREGVFLTASYLERIVWSSAITALFLGGGALPYLSGQQIADFVASAYGPGFGTGFAMLTQAGVFFAKVAAVAVGLSLLCERRVAPTHERGMNLLALVMLPVGLLNAVVTALLLLRFGGAPV